MEPWNGAREGLRARVVWIRVTSRENTASIDLGRFGLALDPSLYRKLIMERAAARDGQFLFPLRMVPSANSLCEERSWCLSSQLVEGEIYLRTCAEKLEKVRSTYVQIRTVVSGQDIYFWSVRTLEVVGFGSG